MHGIVNSFSGPTDIAQINAAPGRAYRPPVQAARRVAEQAAAAPAPSNSKLLNHLQELFQIAGANHRQAHYSVEYAEQVLWHWDNAGEHQNKIIGRLKSALTQIREAKMHGDPEAVLAIFLLKQELMEKLGQTYSLDDELAVLKKNISQDRDSIRHYLNYLYLAKEIAAQNYDDDEAGKRKFLTEATLPQLRALDRKITSRKIKLNQRASQYALCKAELLLELGLEAEAREFVASYTRNNSAKVALKDIAAKLNC